MRPASYYMNQGVDGRPLPSISDRLRSMGMDSSVENRPMIMPIKEDGEWIAPEWFHSMARGAMVPVQTVLGGTVTPADAAMAVVDYTSGGLLASKAIPNAVPDGSVLGATVWHGSPHSFNKFKMDRIGTGEGAQTYGHGLYFAENPNVAKIYADTLGHKGYEFSPTVERKYRAAYNALENKYKRLGLQADKKRGETYVDPDGYEHFKSYDHPEVLPLMERQDEIGLQLTKLDTKMKNEGGREITSSTLYKVDIPDDQIAKMLDWDKPLSEQPKSVMDAVDKILPKSKRDSLAMRGLFGRDDYTKFHTGKTIAKPLGELTGKEIQVGLRSEIRSAFGSDAQNYREALGDADKFLKAVAGREKNSDSLTSAVLKREGIPGIKYLDQGSRGAGQGTRNFVLFDDQIPQILEVNDKPVRGILSGR